MEANIPLRHCRADVCPVHIVFGSQPPLGDALKVFEQNCVFSPGVDGQCRHAKTGKEVIAANFDIVGCGLLQNESPVVRCDSVQAVRAPRVDLLDRHNHFRVETEQTEDR